MVKKTFVFDLDDTLVKEIEFLKSAFRAIATYVDVNNNSLFDEMMKWYYDKENVFLNIINNYPKFKIPKLLEIYRNHFPNFDTNFEIKKMLYDIKNKEHYLGIITDGYSITQRNKLKALDIIDLFDLIIISEEFGTEKPNKNNFEIFHQFQTLDYFYVGDNVSKDFVMPNELGWQTICLIDNGQNIHIQNFEKEAIYLPKFKISNLSEINKLSSKLH